MATLVRTGASVLRYRGGAGQWAWAIHRAAGLGVLAFLLLHIFDIFLASFGPQLFNELLFLYKGPAARILEVVLLFGLLYHALNGLRIILGDFAPTLASRTLARNLFYIQIIVFLLIFIPASYFMLVTLPQQPFNNNAILALLITLGILALPGVIAGVASFVPTASNLALDTDSTDAPSRQKHISQVSQWRDGASTIGNYQDAMARLINARRYGRGSASPVNRTELNIWLFMRVSGFLLIVLALGHFFLMHFFYGVEHIDFQFIVARWMDPLAGWFWRTYDLALLILALTHGVLGARYSIEDYFHHRVVRFLLLAGLTLTWVALVLMGAFVIFSFNVTA